MALVPEIQRSPVAGLVFDRSLGHQFKALTSPAGEYYWKPHLMALLRRCPNLAYFLPSAEFCDSGARVLFTRFSGNDAHGTAGIILSVRRKRAGNHRDHRQHARHVFDSHTFFPRRFLRDRALIRRWCFFPEPRIEPTLAYDIEDELRPRFERERL